MQFYIEIVGFKLNRSYSANRNQSENEDIQEKPNCNLGFLQL